MLGIALGLASSIAWGISDFLGGLQSRRISALTVLLVTQPVGLVLALAVALTAGADPLDGRAAGLATLAGASGVLALAAFYRAMALGSIGVVATIAALGVLVPVVAGFIQGEQPGALQVAGAGVGITGGVLVAQQGDAEWRAAGREAIGLAAFAGIGFGTFFLLLDSAAGGEPAWVIVLARVGGVVLLVALAAVVRPSLRVERSMWPALLAIGCFDILANSLFVVATNHGLLSLVSIAGSMYSAVTILLARAFLGERLSSTQTGGVVLALAGVALIAAGV